MKLRRTLLVTLLVLVPLAALGPGTAAAASAMGASGNVAVFATGLIYPRGLEFGPGGDLYVAEAGPGGDG
jgi:glucose/arabinose dehydrogenase